MIERFDRYVDRCLYDATDGFYAIRGEAGGSRGDFVTSPEVGPLFGAVVARYLDSVWDSLDRPDRFTVVEAAAGRGALAKAILSASPRCAPALDYVTVERSARLREAQRSLLDDSATIAASLDEVHERIVGVILANELLDNLAFRLVVMTEDGWHEAFVEDGAPVLGPLDAPIDLPVGDAPIGTRLPVCEQAHAWVSDATSRVACGRVLVVDYGVAATAELVGRDWLRTYRGHERGGDPFEAPGRTDITCDVPLDQLPPGAKIITQAAFLRSHGIDQLIEEGRRIWAERAHLGDLDAIRARSRVTEAEALLEPDGLGAFLVAEWRVGASSSHV